MPIITTWNAEDFVKVFNATKPYPTSEPIVCVHGLSVEGEDYVVAESPRDGGILLRYLEKVKSENVADDIQRVLEYFADNLDAVVVEGMVE